MVLGLIYMPHWVGVLYAGVIMAVNLVFRYIALMVSTFKSDIMGIESLCFDVWNRLGKCYPKRHDLQRLNNRDHFNTLRIPISLNCH